MEWETGETTYEPLSLLSGDDPVSCAEYGKAVTPVLDLVNATPFQWYSKRQSTVETATFGSKFVAARTAVDQVIYIWNTLIRV